VVSRSDHRQDHPHTSLVSDVEMRASLSRQDTCTPPAPSMGMVVQRVSVSVRQWRGWEGVCVCVCVSVCVCVCVGVSGKVSVLISRCDNGAVTGARSFGGRFRFDTSLCASSHSLHPPADTRRDCVTYPPAPPAPPLPPQLLVGVTSMYPVVPLCPSSSCSGGWMLDNHNQQVGVRTRLK
jgi:hypothetical protein